MFASFVRHGLGSADELVNESVLQLVASSGITSTAIRSAVLCLLTHPRVSSKLQGEVDAAVRAGRVPPSPGLVSDTEARGMPYLQACLKEGMRVHAPAGGPFPRRVPDGGDTVMVDGEPVFLPGATNYAEEFRPGRWLLEKDEEKLTAIHRMHELIFGYGRYQCLGKPIALMEITRPSLRYLMRNFDMCLTRPEKP
ncbi:cytochrome P450 [Parachaetomium inaequale]|uniref:Cytochrome P450 n=1 Tax=Parachaetomium inaequale TaxID=2588326 RepID=A0AAN6PF96_9PEZI|nr:cytochrome P450 [Parachaetomium inaequale]